VCKKTELIKMKFGMLGWAPGRAQGTCITWGYNMPAWNEALLGVSGELKSIVKQSILGSGEVK